MENNQSQQGVKVYANQEAAYSTDKSLIARYESFVANAPLFGDMLEFKREYKQFCNEIREQLGTDNVISFDVDKEKGALLVLTYDVFASQGLTFQQGCDKNGPYLLLDMQTQQGQ